jgi:hypothetical protein
MKKGRDLWSRPFARMQLPTLDAASHYPLDATVLLGCYQTRCFLESY